MLGKYEERCVCVRFWFIGNGDGDVECKWDLRLSERCYIGMLLLFEREMVSCALLSSLFRLILLFLFYGMGF